MATNATLIRECEDGKFATITVHWDGDLTHTGSLLTEHYTDPKRIEALFALGNVCDLGPSIEKPEGHSRDNIIPGYTVFMGRDYNDGIDRHHEQQFWDTLDNAIGDEPDRYTYVWTKALGWYWLNMGSMSHPLDRAVKKALAQA